MYSTYTTSPEREGKTTEVIGNKMLDQRINTKTKLFIKREVEGENKFM